MCMACQEPYSASLFPPVYETGSNLAGLASAVAWLVIGGAGVLF